VTDARGFVTRFHYNEDGNLIKTDLPDNESITYSIDALNQIVALTGPNGNQSNAELMNLVGAGNFFRNPDLEKADPNWLNAADSWVDENGNHLRDMTMSSSGQTSLPMTAALLGSKKV
jgi:YD repeat-containing protein